MKMTVTRFTTFEKDVAGSMSVSDIIELADTETVEGTQNRASTRKRLMRQFGSLLDKMLDGDYGVNVITLEREDREQSIVARGGS